MQETALKKPTLSLKEIAVGQLKSGQYQPRQVVFEAVLHSLTETIKRVGALEPLLVRPVTSSRYEIIADECRWRAAKIARLKTVLCLVGHYGDEQADHIVLIKSLNRKNLSPINYGFIKIRFFILMSWTIFYRS